jgi:hypothetical protein
MQISIMSLAAMLDRINTRGGIPDEEDMGNKQDDYSDDDDDDEEEIKFEAPIFFKKQPTAVEKGVVPFKKRGRKPKNHYIMNEMSTP